MRKRHIRHEMKRVGNVNLTPMIDMVFILLIFFLVTTSFVKETGVEINRPSAQTIVRSEQGNILIAITQQGNIWIDHQQVSLAALRTNIARLRAENPGAVVIIQADQLSNTGRLVSVIDQIRLTGISNISIAASEQ
jgi:biopolymer transport protein ExbD